jgi:fructosamine-3-kinase
MWDVIAQHIQQVTQQPFTIRDRSPVGGGSINQAYRLSDGPQQFFLKLNHSAKVEMFAAEAMGLQALQQVNCLSIPTPICWGQAEQHSYLVLDWLALDQGRSLDWSRLGQQLAKLHRQSCSQGFGWHRDNTIGEMPQRNPWTADWTDFFQQHRLGYQFQLAQRRGGQFRAAERLLAAVPTLMAEHKPLPSLVHGDLWGGNAGFTTDGNPVLFDPAVYYGDREVDLAMTELFGGFPSAFYQGYAAEWPLADGYQTRKTLYNLYHILNHFNLFGGGYLRQAESMIQQLLAQVP